MRVGPSSWASSIQRSSVTAVAFRTISRGLVRGTKPRQRTASAAELLRLVWVVELRHLFYPTMHLCKIYFLKFYRITLPGPSRYEKSRVISGCIVAAAKAFRQCFPHWHKGSSAHRELTIAQKVMGSAKFQVHRLQAQALLPLAADSRLVLSSSPSGKQPRPRAPH